MFWLLKNNNNKKQPSWDYAVSVHIVLITIKNPLYNTVHNAASGVFFITPQWGAADAEIKVPPGENTELKRSPFQAWSRSVYSHTCDAYCRGFLPWLFLPFRSIHLHFFQNLSRVFPVLAVASTSSCVGPQNKIGNLAGCRFQCWVPTEYR